MKILFVIDTLGSGGKERRLTELLKALKLRREVEFELVVMSEDIHFTEIYDLGINVRKILRETAKGPYMSSDNSIHSLKTINLMLFIAGRV